MPPRLSRHSLGEEPPPPSERITLLVGRIRNRGRFWRRAGKAGMGLLGVVVFGAALVGGALLHLDLEPSRRIARIGVNALLATPFRGRLEIGPISRIDATSADIEEVRIFDDGGRLILQSWGIRGEIDTLRLLRSLVDGTGPLVVRIPRAQIERAELRLIDDGTGLPTIATTFEPRVPSPPDPLSQAVRVMLPNVELGRVDMVSDLGTEIRAFASRVVGRVRVTEDDVTVDVEDTGVGLRSLIPGGAQGAATYHLRVWIADGPPPTGTHGLSMWADFSGEASGLGVIGRWEMTDDRMKVRVDIPQATPTAVRALVPDLPLLNPARGQLVAEGPLEAMELSARLEIEPSKGGGEPAVVMLDGDLSLSDGLTLRSDFYAREIDLAAIREDLPRSQVDGRGRGLLHLGDGSVRLSLDVATDATLIAAQLVPALDAQLTLLEGGEILVSAHAHETGATVDAAAHVLGDGSILFGAEAHSRSLREMPRLRGMVDGSLDLRVRGEMRDGKLQARTTATAGNLQLPGLRARSTTLRGTIEGPPPDFDVELEADAKDVRVGDGDTETALASLTVRAGGPLLTPHVSAELVDTAEGRGRASGRLDVLGQTLRGATVSLERDGEHAEGSVDEVSFGGGGVSVRGVTLQGSGMGGLKGSLGLESGELVGKLAGTQLDVARVAKLLGLRAPIAGVANVDVAIVRSREGRTGHLEVELERGRVAVVDGISARLSAAFTGDRVEASGFVRLVEEATPAERAAATSAGEVPAGNARTGTTTASKAATLCDGAIAEVRLASLDAELQGPLLEASTWQNAVGAADVAAERWNLHCLTRRYPFLLPVSDARGTLTTRASVRRVPGQPVPSVESLYVRTHGLELVGPKPLLGEAAWASRHIDVELSGSMDGTTGRAPFEVKTFDDTFLATADGYVDFGVLFRDGGTAEGIRDVPFDVAIQVPRRRFDELASLPSPAAESVPAIAGEFRVDATVEGTLRAPRASVRTRVFGVAPLGDASEWSPPIDGEATVVYEAATGNLVIAAAAQHEDATVAQVVAGAHLPYEPLLAGGDGPLKWRAGLSASLSELPIGAIPALADRGVKGSISGRATITGLNENPTFDADLTLPFLSLGETFFDGRIRASITPAPAEEAAALAGGSVDAAEVAPTLGLATLEVELRDQEAGALELLSHARVVWKDRVVPVVDDLRRGGVAMSAERFRLAALQPVVAGVLSKLDGFLDGQAVFEWGDAAGAGRIASAELRVSEGVVYVPQVGQELHSVSAVLRSDGPGDFVLENVEAEGLSGRVTASGRARLSGLTLDEADAIVEIDEDEELPLTFEGVPLGRASGRAELHLENDPEANRVAMQLVLPAFQLSMSSVGTRSVQSLDDHAEITVSAPIGPPEEEARSSEATRWTIALDVRSLVVLVADLAVVEVRTPGANDGNLAPVVFRLEETLTSSGDIVVTRGTFDFLGKEFVVDQGLIRLREEDVGNPFVNGAAHWEGPDGGRIFLDYVGLALPITDDKMKFRSDPSRSEREILATLLFGDSLSDIPPGGSSSSSGDAGSGNVAGTVGASVVSGGLNQILKNSALRRVSAKLGTTDEGNFRTGVEVKISDKVTAEVANERIEASAQSGGAAAGASGTVAGAQSLNEAALRYQFHKNWSVRGSFGVRSGESSDTQGLLGLDLLWQYRY